MKNSKMFMMVGMMVVLVMVLVVGGGVMMQGKLSKSNKQLVAVSVNSFSPSGSRNVSSSDEVASYKICAGKEGNVHIGSTGIDFISRDDSLDPGTFNSESYTSIKYGSTTLTGGNFKIKSESTYLVSTIASFKEPLKIEKGKCKNISVGVDSMALMNEDLGIGDHLQVNLVELYSVANGVGDVSSNAPVFANPLNY